MEVENTTEQQAQSDALTEARFDLHDDDTRVYFITRSALKAMGDGRIGGYLVVWGDPGNRDAYGEYFTPDTQFNLDWYDKRPVLYHHGLDKKAGKQEIGMITRIRADDYGLYAEAQLDINHEDPVKRKIARSAYDDVLAGKLGWSSGSVPHLVDDEPDGKITRWPIVEGSLTPTPAEPHRTRVSAAKFKAYLEATTEQSVNSLPAETPPAVHAPESTPEPTEPETVKEAATEDVPEGAFKTQPETAHRIFRKVKGGVKMDLNALIESLRGEGVPAESILNVVAQYSGTSEEPDEAVMADTEEEMPEPPTRANDEETYKADDVEKIVAKAVEKAMRTAPANTDKPAVDGAATTQAPRIEVGWGKYRDMSALDMAYYAQLRNMLAVKQGIFRDPNSAEYYAEMLDKAQRGIKSGDIKLDREDHNRLTAIKTNELVNTGYSTAASEWVPTLWSSDLWERAPGETQVFSQFQSFDMPSNPFTIPVESSDPTVYHVPETTNETQLTLDSSNSVIPDSQVQSTNKTITAEKLALRVGYSAEMDEDSIIPFVPQLRTQAMRAIMNAVDYALLHGDTTTGTGNISLNGTNIAATDTYRFLAFNGLRHLPLVTTTSLAIDAEDKSPTLTKIREAYGKMYSLTDWSENIYANDPSNLVIFADVPTYNRLLSLDEALVWQINGRNSTFNDGILRTVDGIPVYQCNQMRLTDTSGYINGTAASNTQGSMVIAAKSAWYIGYRRRVTSVMEYLSYYDSYQLTATVRVGFINRDNIGAAVLYNIDVGN